MQSRCYGWRQQFVASLQQFIDTSQETKQAAIIGTTDGFAKRRTREALAIAHLFTSVVPESARRERFDRFVGNAEHGMQVFKLLDSVVDMGRDSRNGNINIEPTATNRLRLLGRAAMSGLRAGAAVRFDPRLLWRGGLKTLTMIKNRSGKLNAQRTNQ